MRKTVLWGYDFNEYRDMFFLTEQDSNGKILEYGCGPTAVNHERTDHHQYTISCDPYFKWPQLKLQEILAEQFDKRAQFLRTHAPQFDFSAYGGLEETIRRRQKGIQAFLADYEKGRLEGRYLGLELAEDLAFDEGCFDLALSSHFFFTGVASQTVEYHLNQIKALARIAKEVRIFPLIDTQGHPSPLLGPVLLGLSQENYGVEVKEVPYHVQPKGNAILKVWAQSCAR